jgi:hypothetical protein
VQSFVKCLVGAVQDDHTFGGPNGLTDLHRCPSVLFRDSNSGVPIARTASHWQIVLCHARPPLNSGVHRVEVYRIPWAWHIESRPGIQRTFCATGSPAHTEISNPSQQRTLVRPLTPETPTKPTRVPKATHPVSPCGDGIDLHRRENERTDEGNTRKCKSRERCVPVACFLIDIS